MLGLAGRDIQNTIEIFLEFCRSGNLSGNAYFQITILRGNYSLPYDVVTRVLLRRNRRFYDGDSSFLVNLFQCFPTDARPDSFVRLAILSWLRQFRQVPGPTGISGFHKASVLIGDLAPLGHDAKRTHEEIIYLVKRGCILTEHQYPELRSIDDLIRLSSSGYVHLQVASDISYLAACAEYTWIASESTAKEIANRIGFFGPQVHYSSITSASNVSDFIKSLLARLKDDVATPRAYLEKGFLGIAAVLHVIANDIGRKFRTLRSTGGWDRFDEKFFQGMQCRGTVTGTQVYGVFVKLDDGPIGLLYHTNLPPNRPVSTFNLNDRIVVSIIRIQKEAEKISHGFIKIL